MRRSDCHGWNNRPTAVASVLGNSVPLLKAIAGAIPPAQRRSHANREQRRAAYLAFQRASLDAMSWADYMVSLETVVTSRLQMIQMHPTLVRELSGARACAVNLLGALGEVRMVGNPKPRIAAEEITALIGYLYETIPTERPALHYQWAVAQADSRPELADLIQRSAFLGRRLNKLREVESRWRQRAMEFADCMQALGIAHRELSSPHETTSDRDAAGGNSVEPSVSVGTSFGAQPHGLAAGPALTPKISSHAPGSWEPHARAMESGLRPV